MTAVVDHYAIKTLEDLIKSGENFNFEDVSPDLVTLKIKIHGDQFDGSITGEVAKSLGMFQAALYRVAAEVLSGSSSITSLSAEEKAALEIVIKISPGCSDVQIPGWKYICAFLDKVTENMDSKHKCIVACFAICGFTGVTVTPFITNVLESDNTVGGMVEQAKVLTEPLKAAVASSGDQAAKSARNAESFDWGDRHYDREDIRKLNSRAPRQKAQTDTFDMTCHVMGYHRDGTIIKVDLKSVDTGEEFTVKVPPPGLFDETMPERPSDVANIMEIGACVSVTVLIKETKSKTERMLVSWDVITNETSGNS